jgi:hypothetical protein
MKIFIKTFIFLSFLIPSMASAAVLSVTPNVVDPNQARPFVVSVVLDTQGADINTIEGIIKIAPGLEAPSEVIDANSIVNYWVQPPQVGSEIKFSGGMSNGYKGSKGYLFSLEFPPHSGKNLNNAISFSQVKAYLSDGLATPVNISANSLSLRPGVVASEQDPDIQALAEIALNDNVAPEDFNPQVSRQDGVLDGKWFVVFSTQDKQSGIDHYEVQESLSGKIDPAQWKTATSPYALQDQKLQSYIFILAQDKQGNEKVVRVFPRNPQAWYKKYSTDLIVIVLLLVFGVVGFYYRRNQIKRKLKLK